jgi:hypothetical protein
MMLILRHYQQLANVDCLAANNDDAEYMFNVLRELDDEIDIVMNDNIGDANVDVNDPY